MHAHKVILGQSLWLEQAAEDWLLKQPEISLDLIEVVLDDRYCFDFSTLDNLDPSKSTFFLAWGPKFLNFQRMELMAELKNRGFKMPALIHPSAQVSPSATFHENVWIQAQAIVGPKVSLGINTHVGIGTRIGLGSHLSNHAWLGHDVRLGTNARVGANAIIGDGVRIADSVRIGRQANIETLDFINFDWPDKAFRLLRSKLQGQIVDYSASVSYKNKIDLPKTKNNEISTE